MADIEVSKHVSEIPQGQRLPEPYQRSVQAEVTPFPDIQSAMSEHAASTNWMSTIGSAVATRASNALASELGTRLGKNPKGDIGIPLTEFDAVMQQSYKTQSQATLGIQATKLINDTNLQVAKSPRITHKIIDSANKSIGIGLKNIFDNAPAEVRPQLEYQYGHQQISFSSDLTLRMIKEQREDRKHTTALSSVQNAESAYSFAIKGNLKAANVALQSTIATNEADVAARVTTPEQAKTNIDTARKSLQSGKLIHDYEMARAEGKGEEFLKNVADKSDKGNADYLAVSHNLLQYVHHQQSLRLEDEQLATSKINVSIARDPMGVTGAQLEEYRQTVSPAQFEKTQLNYINAVKKFTKSRNDANLGVISWTNPAAFVRAGNDSVNKAFDVLVPRYIQQRNEQGIPVSQEEAEVQIAASAAGTVPHFVQTLSNKLNSNNPSHMDSAARQIDELYSMNAHQALKGLSDQDKTIFTQYKTLHDSLPPLEAAKIAIQNANQDPETQNMNKEKWAAFVKTSTGGLFGGVAPTEFALKQVHLSKDDFLNPGIANVYGQMILDKYGDFYQMSHGDQVNALKLVQQNVKENYGYTGVNGHKTMTLHPIEKILGYEENSDVVPFIQQDVISKLNESFIPFKESFNKNESNVYWDVVPTERKDTAWFGHTFPPIQVKRYTKTSKGVKTDLYNVILIGNSFNWDVALSTDSGIRPLIQMAPYLGIHTYTPNKKSIDDAYMKAHGIKK